jgi:hypothetical protein
MRTLSKNSNNIMTLELCDFSPHEIQLRIDSCQKGAIAIEQSVAQRFAQFSPEQKYRYAKASFFDRASKCSLSFRACGSGADRK